MLKLNPKIKEVLQEFNIDVQDGLSYLLSIYFDCRPSYTPPILVQKINVANILHFNGKELLWLIPLFEDNNVISEDKWEWVSKWMDKFSARNSLRRGTKSTSISRMKVFFSENPDVRKEDILLATDMYLRNTADTYIMKSHKFIFDGTGKMRNSTLEEWLAKYYLTIKEIPNTDGIKDITSQMQ